MNSKLKRIIDPARIKMKKLNREKVTTIVDKVYIFCRKKYTLPAVKPNVSIKAKIEYID